MNRAFSLILVLSFPLSAAAMQNSSAASAAKSGHNTPSVTAIADSYPIGMEDAYASDSQSADATLPYDSGDNPGEDTSSDQNGDDTQMYLAADTDANADTDATAQDPDQTVITADDSGDYVQTVQDASGDVSVVTVAYTQTSAHRVYSFSAAQQKSRRITAAATNNAAQQKAISAQWQQRGVAHNIPHTYAANTAINNSARPAMPAVQAQPRPIPHAYVATMANLRPTVMPHAYVETPANLQSAVVPHAYVAAVPVENAFHSNISASQFQPVGVAHEYAAPVQDNNAFAAGNQYPGMAAGMAPAPDRESRVFAITPKTR
jgi:hypothetical protein